MAAPKHEIKIIHLDTFYPTSASNTMSVEDAARVLMLRQLNRNYLSMFRSKPKKTGKRN